MTMHSALQVLAVFKHSKRCYVARLGVLDESPREVSIEERGVEWNQGQYVKGKVETANSQPLQE